MIRNFRATRSQRLLSDVRYLRHYAADIVAAIATLIFLLLIGTVGAIL